MDIITLKRVDRDESEVSGRGEQLKVGSPAPEFEALVLPRGAKLGSKHVDANFDSWLKTNFENQRNPNTGNRSYEDFRGTTKHQELMSSFVREKEKFRPGNYPVLNFAELVSFFQDKARSPDIAQFCRRCNEEESDSEKHIKHEEGSHSRIILPSKLIESFFDPVVDEIVNMTRDHVSEANRSLGSGTEQKVVLAGGFGSSNYLITKASIILARREA